MNVRSDVWMFGVAMWEIFAKGAPPFNFPEMNWRTSVKGFAKELMEGSLRLDFPEGADEDLIKVLSNCLEPDNEERPNADALHESLCKALCHNKAEDDGGEVADAEEQK
mmetsp:Transcript_31995/g.62593  ORF Transcript_31995/g.62593 Transcript_31995/m.62593 type:complete len:109 (-) Transcript_31995:42-368(-)